MRGFFLHFVSVDVNRHVKILHILKLTVNQVLFKQDEISFYTIMKVSCLFVFFNGKNNSFLLLKNQA